MEILLPGEELLRREELVRQGVLAEKLPWVVDKSTTRGVDFGIQENSLYMMNDNDQKQEKGKCLGIYTSRRVWSL